MNVAPFRRRHREIVALHRRIEASHKEMKRAARYGDGVMLELHYRDGQEALAQTGALLRTQKKELLRSARHGRMVSLLIILVSIGGWGLTDNTTFLWGTVVGAILHIGYSLSERALRGIKVP